MPIQPAIAMLFPGQGSQKIGMLADYADHFPSIKQLFDISSEICDEDLWGIVQNGPAEKLNDTRITQPAMFTADVAIWQVWQNIIDIKPHIIAGHSLGEYAALVCAEVLSFKDAAFLVAQRARLMADGYPIGKGGAGVIVNATQLDVEHWCKEVSRPKHEVYLANINSPTQLVISGHLNAVKEVLALAKKHDIKLAMLLPVSVPVHCPLMKKAADQLKSYIDDMIFNHPSIPIIFNVDAVCHYQPMQIKKALYEQLFKPVQWLKTMDLINQNKPTDIVEAGPGTVLTGLYNKTFKSSDIKAISLNKLSQLQEFHNHG